MQPWFYYMSSERTDRVIINLKVIAYVKPDERISMRNNSFSIQPPGWVQCMTRWQYGESRWANLDDIKNVVEDALRIMGSYLSMFKGQLHNTTGETGGGGAGQYPLPTPENCANYIADIVKELEGAMAGLTNLKVTYANDPLMRSHLDLLVQRMNDEIQTARRAISTPTSHTVSSSALPIPTRSRQTQRFTPSLTAAAAMSAPPNLTILDAGPFREKQSRVDTEKPVDGGGSGNGSSVGSSNGSNDDGGDLGENDATPPIKEIQKKYKNHKH